MTPKELLTKWIAAMNARDIDAVVECYADDAVNFQVAAGQPAIGRENIRKDSEAFFAAFPDAWSRIENLMEDGSWAAWEWIGGGTFTGEFAGVKGAGQTFEIRGCGFFQIEEDKIVYQRGYWDKHSWFSQIGIPLD